ncbi:ATP-binding protein [Neobacillus sp. PS3-34]|uniref:two-component system sensor histidine kinase NtrB n=1 Tax=Neobacillus sp. PS3-34 TaxID=3070678 RepID=UPI0027E10235|nr:ATP-binding protein [Neobacillus sp. PS3-34]WML47895.1 ATP-binding protein [Neobacillus sp. PS3-34]
MDTMKLQLENEKLKEELEIYKGIIEELPFSFVFKDYEHGVLVEKEISQKKDYSMKKIFPDPSVKSKKDFSFTSPPAFEFEIMERFLAPLLDYVPHHITFIDENGYLTLCNLQAANDLHANRNELIGKHIRELLKLPDEQIIMLQTLKSKKPIVDREILDKNYGIINTRIIYNPDGSVKRVIGLFLFLNAIKDAEKQALAGRIAAGIAHEIRNPLTTVRGYLQMLQHSVDGNIAELFSTLLIPEIDRANKIINDFLSISKPSQTAKEKLLITELILKFIGNFLNSEAHLHNVHLDYIIDDSVGNEYIEGSRDELLQVFINLFRNSLQAAPNIRLVITIKAKRIGSKVLLQFADNGIGIKPSLINHIFDPFFSTKEEGTGLGLSVSKKIIENHKGKMQAVSDSSGTIFNIELPLMQ